MKTIAVLSVLSLTTGGTTAFAPSNSFQNEASATFLRMSDETPSVFDAYAGNVDFRGKEFNFDPLNLSESYPPFQGWFRECELRHGRTAMLAVLGFIATDYFRIPGEMYSFEAIPKTIDAHDILLKSGPMYQLALWIGLFDLLVTAPAVQAMGEGEREPGDFAWLWFAPKTEEGFEKKRTAELMNGRLAMIAVGGIATQSIIGGHGFPYLY